MVALALWLVPAVLAGFLASRWLNRFLDAARLSMLALARPRWGACC